MHNLTFCQRLLGRNFGSQLQSLNLPIATDFFKMSSALNSSGSEDGFESDDPVDYCAEGNRPDCNICRDFNFRYLGSDARNAHHYSSLVRSSRDGCFTCKILEEIITGLFKFEDASLVAFNFEFVSLRDLPSH